MSLRGIKMNVTAINSIYLNEDTGGKGRFFKSRFLQAGLVKYQFGVCLLKKETIDKFVNTFIGCPVVINHQDVTDESAKEQRVGVISRVYFEPSDAWFWCEGVLFDSEAIDLVQKGYTVSCQYEITEYSDNSDGELHNGNPYDKEILGGRFEHLAIVDSPRYEDAIIAVNAICKNEFDENAHPRDKDGKFSNGNNSNFYNEKSKSIELKGNELGTSDDEIRKNGLEYYKSNLQGKKFNNKELGDVLFSRVGLNKLNSNSADINKIKAIPALKDIIETGEYQGTEDLKHPRKDGIVKFHRINQNVSIDGKKENMSVLIGEDRDGNRFYNLNNSTYTAENSSRVIRAKGRADEEFSINIIAYNSTDFNPNITEYQPIIDYIENYNTGGTMDKETRNVFEKLISALKAKNEADDEKEKDKEKDDKAANADDDKRAGIDKVAGILKSAGADEETIRTCIGIMEKLAYDKSEAGTADNKAKNKDEDPQDGKKDDKKEEKAENEGDDDKKSEKDEKKEEKEEKAANKCKNDDDELLDEAENKAKNKKAKNSMDALKKLFYEGAETHQKQTYMTQKQAIELGKQMF